ncbi:MAG: CBS domain-containing protein [Marivibrio sp.]|uniref:CBS domain-containing protein n=1 Tax=Marivibrio sp. TaxID=2039719 RepID=UPI0032ED511C
MQISQVMTPDCEWIALDASVVDAAQRMRDQDIGAVAVGDGEKLVGVVTDRDIVVRAVAEDATLRDAKVSDVMTDKVLYLFEDQTTDEAARNMAETGVRRMPVVDRDKTLKGVVTVGDLAKAGEDAQAGDALRQIAAA